MSIAERYRPKATQFSRRWRWILLGIIASGILIFSYRAGNHSNLVYQNHEIDYWIRELYNGRYYSWRLNAPPPNSPPRLAMVHFGEKATPFLIREFEHTDSIVSRKLRPYLAGKSWLESFDITRFFDTPDLSRRRALEGFVCIGNEGKDAIPRLSYHLIHSSSRNLAAFALGFIGPESIPALLQGLSHKDPHIRTAAATGLQLISPAADPIIAALLNELDIEYDGRNSWTNRAYVRLTARELEADCYHTPAYPELGEVIKTRAPKAIRAATETALEDFDAEQLLESRRTQSTQAFYSLSNQAEPCFRSFLTDQAIEEFFKEVNSVTKSYPELSFACDLLRLDLLLWQGRMEDISPLIERLKQQADQSWIKWRDLANVFVQGANRNRRFPREHAIEAAETALSLARHAYGQNLIRLCISAYGRQSNHPRVNELKADSLYSGIENPFLIGIPKAFPQRSLPPSTRVPTPSPIGEP